MYVLQCILCTSERKYFRIYGALQIKIIISIIIKFANYKDHELMLAAAKKKQPRGIYVNEDFLQRIRAKHKELLPKMMKAIEEGKIVYLSFDKLVVRDRD